MLTPHFCLVQMAVPFVGWNLGLLIEAGHGFFHVLSPSVSRVCRVVTVGRFRWWRWSWMPCQQDMAVVAPCFFMGHVTSPPAYPCANFLTKTAQDKEKIKKQVLPAANFFFLQNALSVTSPRNFSLVVHCICRECQA